jgi:hypothetical protein
MTPHESCVVSLGFGSRLRAMNVGRWTSTSALARSKKWAEVEVRSPAGWWKLLLAAAVAGSCLVFGRPAHGAATSPANLETVRRSEQFVVHDTRRFGRSLARRGRDVLKLVSSNRNALQPSGSTERWPGNCMGTADRGKNSMLPVPPPQQREHRPGLDAHTDGGVPIANS